jgi:acyl dehydratase
MVDTFGALTSNLDPMHNNPERARELNLFGGRTVSYGLLTLALTTRFLKMIPDGVFYSDEEAHTINYGIDAVRWPAPTYVGTPIRARVTLVDVVERAPGQVKNSYQFVIEQQGEDKPRMVATTHALIAF